MIRKFNVLVLSLAATLPAFAMDAAQSEAKQTVPLVNGETLYVFKDGKMGMEDRLGRVVGMKPGQVVLVVDDAGTLLGILTKLDLVDLLTATGAAPAEARAALPVFRSRV